MPRPPNPTVVLPDPWVTDRFELRPPTLDDVDWITVAAQDDDVRRFTTLPTPYDRQDALDYVRFAEESIADGTGVHVLVIEREGHELLGAVGLMLDWRDAEAELGYWLAPPARGRGAGKAAARALARSLGFVHEGTMRLAGIDGPTGDRTAPRVDMEIYGLLPGELR